MRRPGLRDGILKERFLAFSRLIELFLILGTLPTECLPCPVIIRMFIESLALFLNFEM